jgi:hypothetical protein
VRKYKELETIYVDTHLMVLAAIMTVDVLITCATATLFNTSFFNPDDRICTALRINLTIEENNIYLYKQVSMPRLVDRLITDIIDASPWLITNLDACMHIDCCCRRPVTC